MKLIRKTALLFERLWHGKDCGVADFMFGYYVNHFLYADDEDWIDA